MLTTRKFILYALLAVITVPIFLNHSGFCYADGTYLTRREVVDRMLFGKGRAYRTFEDKVLLSKEIRKGDYPNNCRISKVTTNGLFLIYDVDCMWPRAENIDGKTTDLFYYSMFKADACGKILDSKGEAFEKETFYKGQIERNKKYWEKWNTNK